MKNSNFTVLWVVLLCVAWLQSSHFLPWVSFHSELVAFVAFAALFAACLFARTAVGSIEIPSVTMPMVLLLVVVLLQAGAGMTAYIGDTVVFVLYLLAMIFAAIAGHRLGATPAVMHQLAWGVVFAGILSAVVAAVQSMHPAGQYTVINPMPYWRRPGANLAQPNHLGTLLLWALVSAMFLLAAKKISSSLASLICVILMVGVAMTESRTALLGVFAIGAWSGVRYFQGAALRRSALALGFVVGGTLLFLLWPPFIVGFQEGGWSGGVVSQGSVNTQVGVRMVVWPQLLAAIMERPWLGWGVRGVSVAHNAVLDRYVHGDPFTYAHNLILDLAIGVGIPLAMLLLSFATVWCTRRMRHVRHSVDWYAMALLIPFMLHSMLEFPYAYAYFLLPACFAIGAIESARFEGVVLHLPRQGATAIFSMWLVLGGIVVRDYFYAEEDFRIARFEALKVGHTSVSYERPELLLLNQLNAMNLATRLVPEPEMTTDSLELLRKAALRFPWTAIQNRYAIALALNGNVPEAQRQLKVMRAMHGEKMYEAIRDQWGIWAQEKYPQLNQVVPP